MKFDNTPPEWNNAGEEPTEHLKQNGFMPGYKPAAKVFNWFFALVGKCLNEIQTKLNDVEDGAQKNTITGIKGDAESSYRTGNVNLTKANIGLGNVPNVATNDQTPTYSQASTLTNLTSGEKMSVSFGKIMKAIAEFITHKGSTSNPHGVTKSQVGLSNVPNVTTDNQTPTYTEAEDLETLTSGETLSTAFGKIKKAITEFISHTGKTSDSSSASALSSTDTNYPTVRDIYFGLPIINGTHSYTSSTSIYAPTSAGTSGYELVSNVSGAPVWKKPSYAVCSTVASTAAKTASISNFKLTTGVRVLVKFNYEHTSSTAATLNVNNTGAKSIVVHCGTTNIFVQNYFTWLAGETVEFVYDGTYWVAIASDMRFVTGAQSATVVIGTTKTQGYCDFRCDGTNDATMFQNAISRLNTYMTRNPISEDAVMWTKGGKILIKEGSYHIDTTLTLSQSNSGVFITFEGEGKFGTVISTEGLETFMSNFESLSFKSLTLRCLELPCGDFFATGNNLSFDDCYVQIRNTATNDTVVGCFAYVTSSVEIGESIVNGDGTFRLSNSEMEIYTLGTMNCYSGIVCDIVEIENSKIVLHNESTDSNAELNLIYSTEKGGYISNCIIACKGRTTVVNSSKVNMSSNVISLQSTTAKISHYDTSVTTLGGTFTGNTVYCNYYVYMRFATITGNKFLKLDAYSANSNTCYLYNQCPATIVGNCFDGGTNSSGTHGTWYINTSSLIVCKQNISVGTLSKASNVPTSSLFADNLNVG